MILNVRYLFHELTVSAITFRPTDSAFSTGFSVKSLSASLLAFWTVTTSLGNQKHLELAQSLLRPRPEAQSPRGSAHSAWPLKSTRVLQVSFTRIVPHLCCKGTAWKVPSPQLQILVYTGYGVGVAYIEHSVGAKCSLGTTH